MNTQQRWSGTGMPGAWMDVRVDEALVAAEYPWLVSYCSTLLGDHGAAHDVAEEAFARLFARWIGVRDPRDYLFRAATNLVRRRWRPRSRLRRAVVARLSRQGSR